MGRAGPPAGHRQAPSPSSGGGAAVVGGAVAVGPYGRPAEPARRVSGTPGAVGAVGLDGPASRGGEDPVGAPLVAGARPGAAAVVVERAGLDGDAAGADGAQCQLTRAGHPQRDLDLFAGGQPAS